MHNRFYAVMMVVIAGVLGTALFVTSEQVQRREKTLRVLQDQMGFERDALQTLQAEWAYLNRPDRLEELAHRFLDLVPPDAAQVTDIAGTIPEAVMPAPNQILPANFVPGDVQPTAAVRPVPVAPAPGPSFQQLIDRLADDDGDTQ